MTRWATVLTLVFLSACGSSASTYYTLAPVRSDAQPVACARPPVSIRRPLLPGVLDRDSVVRMKDATALEISAEDRWASPLDGMIQSVLVQDLRGRLGSTAVLLPGDAQAATGARVLTLNIVRFAGDPAGRVTLQADWLLAAAGGNPVSRRSEAIEVPSGGRNTQDVVTAMSLALGQLSDRVALVLRDCAKGGAKGSVRGGANGSARRGSAMG